MEKILKIPLAEYEQLVIENNFLKEKLEEVVNSATIIIDHRSNLRLPITKKRYHSGPLFGVPYPSNSIKLPFPEITTDSHEKFQELDKEVEYLRKFITEANSTINGLETENRLLNKKLAKKWWK